MEHEKIGEKACIDPSLHLLFAQTPGPQNVASALFCGEILS